MNYADIRPIDVANGPGVRVSLFVSGCPHRCPGCFNPETWDFQYGQGFGEEQVRSILDLLRPGYIRGLTLLGGEPKAPANQPEVLSLVRRVRQELPGRDIWCYTGYLYEELAAGRVGPLDRELLHELDVLVDGPFLLEQTDIRLRFRGSANSGGTAPRTESSGSPELSGLPLLFLSCWAYISPSFFRVFVLN